MSLSVYLISSTEKASKQGSGIFIREKGATKEISLKEWQQKFPDREPVICQVDLADGEVYSANITHNLSTMADEAGIYKYLWQPEEVNITRAEQLIEPLAKGLDLLKSDPDKFKTFNPKNGWGNYQSLVSFIERYLEACELHPTATVSVCR